MGVWPGRGRSSWRCITFQAWNSPSSVLWLVRVSRKLSSAPPPWVLTSDPPPSRSYCHWTPGFGWSSTSAGGGEWGRGTKSQNFRILERGEYEASLEVQRVVTAVLSKKPVKTSLCLSMCQESLPSHFYIPSLRSLYTSHSRNKHSCSHFLFFFLFFVHRVTHSLEWAAICVTNTS